MEYPIESAEGPPGNRGRELGRRKKSAFRTGGNDERQGMRVRTVQGRGGRWKDERGSREEEI
jgi:hypothetical protein